MLACNCLIPQALWFRGIRRNIVAVVLISIALNMGMWLERILIIWNTLSHGYAVSLWRLFSPTLWDWLLLFGPLGLFVFMFLCFIRLVPAVPMYEVRALCRREGVS
jgi:molybdopterin-containing oxidoreductase family membrane subunit